MEQSIAKRIKGRASRTFYLLVCPAIVALLLVAIVRAIIRQVGG